MKRNGKLKRSISLALVSGLFFVSFCQVPVEKAHASSYEAQSKLSELKKQSEENDKAIKDAEAQKQAAEAAVDVAQGIADKKQENADRYKALYNEVRTNLDLTKLEVEDMKYELSKVNES